MNLPKHLRPLSDSTKPVGQMHWKPPGVFVQDPKRQMLGSSLHSLISVKQWKNFTITSVAVNSLVKEECLFIYVFIYLTEAVSNKVLKR